ncbi:hypothetical protein ACH5RR_025573 [Cinchona calisaya]|uniref:Zinc knuckle CX2CX4HX4C domain-containing protein n=1 Tax=Cinchona calisaya TaxID=153742 RepID=A0ABD2Z015_9GENT
MKKEIEEVANRGREKRFANKTWNCNKKIKTVELATNLYQFTFGNKDDFEREVRKEDIKLLVEVDLSQPLLRGTTVKTKGEIKWVEFRYEEGLEFCYTCGSIGHNFKGWNKRIEENQDRQEPQFGAWIRSSYPPTKKQGKEQINENQEDNDKHPTVYKQIEWVKEEGELRTNKINEGKNIRGYKDRNNPDFGLNEGLVTIIIIGDQHKKLAVDDFRNGESSIQHQGQFFNQGEGSRTN